MFREKTELIASGFTLLLLAEAFNLPVMTRGAPQVEGFLVAQ